MEPTKTMNFSEALSCLKQGMMLTRMGWNGRSQYLRIQSPSENSLMTLPYIFITTVTGDRVPWLASQTDILAEDWMIFEHIAQG